LETLGHNVNKVHKAISQQAVCKIDKSVSVDSQALIFSERLAQIIRPKNQSDRTGFRRIANWLLRGIKDGKYQAEILETVLSYAVEAAGPDSRNPAAVFMKILKTELGYGKEST
jgi:hypothetical protein